MNFNKYKGLLFFAVFAYFCSSLEGQCIICPKEIDNSLQNAIVLRYNGPVPFSAGQVKLFQKDVVNNGDKLFAYATSPTTLKVVDVPVAYLGVPMDLDIQISDKRCSIESNQFTFCFQISPPLIPTSGCGEELELCRQEIVDFVVLNIPDIEAINCSDWNGECNFSSPINRAGSMGIGLSNIPNGFKLGVKDGVICEDVEVRLCENTNWCDYVFEEKYDLLPLVKVEEFIKINHHLPNVINQKQINDQNGIELSIIKRQQLEKLEELYLYIFQLEDKKDELANRISLMAKENQLLKKLHDSKK